MQLHVITIRIPNLTTGIIAHLTQLRDTLHMRRDIVVALYYEGALILSREPHISFQILEIKLGGIYRVADVDSSIRLAEHLQTSPSRNVDIGVDSFQVHGAPDGSFVVGPFPAGKVVEDALEVVGVAGLKGVGS